MRSLTTAALAAFLALGGAIGTARADDVEGFIPGLTPAAIIDQLESMGLDCTADLPSLPGNDPDTVTAKCVNEFPDAGVAFDGTVVYWEDGRVSYIFLGFDFLTGSAVDVDPDFVTQMLVQLARTPYEASDPDAVEAFVRDMVANPDRCEGPLNWCELTIGSVRFWLGRPHPEGFPSDLHMFGLAPLTEPTAAPVPLPDTSAKSTGNGSLALVALALAIAMLGAIGRAAAAHNRER